MPNNRPFICNVLMWVQFKTNRKEQKKIKQLKVNAIYLVPTNYIIIYMN